MHVITDPNASEDQVIVSQLQAYPQGFDPQMARRLAGLIQQSYTQFESRIDFQTWRLEDIYQIDTELAQKNIPFGFVASEVNSDRVYVIFRGTRRFVEWFKDANVQLVSYQGSRDKDNQKVEVNDEIAEGLVQNHQSSLTIPNIAANFGFTTAGFRGIYVSLREQLLATLKRKPAHSKILVAGHSLGGALATLAIPDILKNTPFTDPQNVELYTFASPRCGDRHFANSFHKLGVQHWRIANTEDVITMLPFPTGNVVKPAPIEAEPEREVTEGAAKGNPFFQFLRGFYDSRKQRMADYAHTGTPIYFTIHEGALERHHNLDEVYMLGISQAPLQIAAKEFVHESVEDFKLKLQS